MRETINVHDITLGMYVILPLSWIDHPFKKNDFILRNQDQIDKILLAGFKTILIDRSREEKISTPAPTAVMAGDPASTPPRVWTPQTLVPAELREAIHDKTLPPKQKSKVVYESSRVMVERLFEDPKTENIREAKKGISEIVDLIIADDATSKELLKITSYDFYTYTHSVNVGVFGVLLARSAFRGSDAHNLHELGAGFFLHDIGKVRIDPGIINKPGKVTDEEMMKIRSHPFQGYQILKETNQLTEECMVIVMQHHEREDGSGYPRRLKGDDIHIYGRICSIADVYDALTAERSYKQRLETFPALKLMKEQLYNHFHQDLFERFVRLFT